MISNDNESCKICQMTRESRLKSTPTLSSVRSRISVCGADVRTALRLRCTVARRGAHARDTDLGLTLRPAGTRLFIAPLSLLNSGARVTSKSHGICAVRMQSFVKGYDVEQGYGYCRLQSETRHYNNALVYDTMLLS